MRGARPAAGGGRWVEISPERIRGWLDGFYGRHDGATEQGLTVTGASNGDTATLHPPPGVVGVTDIDGLLTALIRPPRIGLLVARKGAVAAGIVDGTTITASKVERHYVQGRTAAGGQSQQRYARRRDNQATAAAGKAADIVARVLLPHVPGAAESAADTRAGAGAGAEEPIRALVCGGDRLMVDAVLADRRLALLLPLRHAHLLDCPEPRLAVLQDAAVTARRVRIHLVP
ncbi:acVLRF1 family peptidyl-tRNA hydrolase [Solwaraspora sp. WMMD406]|uniref:acVLRF1 family peptidyl-tRNA hydrolase n=1 Tax=Solwaraspora sp. WMMD406 TaxID=3016095 RepID=UPI0024170183|nr:acVLRF1 family peptidyl-tRNA hydrolase [Solwaraspora sp. WMMD406]MDG4765036.1 acVLRF1 family peptidyl-tRNA hydrolase [Solwaraspora sp. WMMD406]